MFKADSAGASKKKTPPIGGVFFLLGSVVNLDASAKTRKLSAFKSFSVFGASNFTKNPHFYNFKCGLNRCTFCGYVFACSYHKAYFLDVFHDFLKQLGCNRQIFQIFLFVGHGFW